MQPHSICPLLRCRLALAAPQAKVMRPPGLRRAPQVGDHLCRGPGAAGPSPPHLCEDRAPDIGGVVGPLLLLHSTPRGGPAGELCVPLLSSR